MAKIVSFTYCDNVANDMNGNPIITRPLQMITPMAIPSNFTFSISFGVYDIDKIEKNCINIDFLDPNDVVISNNELILPDMPREINETPDPVGIQINVEFKNTYIKEEGEYKTRRILNGSKLGEFPINVHKTNIM